MKNNTFKIVTWLSLFAIAMGFLETSVVVYLRELYYPKGFDFPLVEIPKHIAIVEFWREVATIIMLLGAGIMAGKTKLGRFAYLIIAFAIWDLFYYIFLYVLLQWPQSLFTWDILFLVPVPWTGPVIAPCLVSIGLIILGAIILHYENKKGAVKITGLQWTLLIGGVAVIILSFMWDYLSITSGAGKSVWSLVSESNLFEELKTYNPQKFNWPLFTVGLSLSGFGIVHCYLKFKKSIIN